MPSITVFVQHLLEALRAGEEKSMNKKEYE
jgi:hypothetical protein